MSPDCDFDDECGCDRAAVSTCGVCERNSMYLQEAVNVKRYVLLLFLAEQSTQNISLILAHDLQPITKRVCCHERVIDT